MFQERDRTPEQIERRVKYLKLHRETHDSSDEDKREQSKLDDEQDEVPGKYRRAVRESRLEKDLAAFDTVRPRRRLRRGVDFSDNDSDDDMLLGGSMSITVEPLHSSSATTTSEAAVGVSDAISDQERNDAHPAGYSSSEVSSTRVNDALDESHCQDMEATQVLQDFQQSCLEHQIEQPTKAQPDDTEVAPIRIVAEVTTIDGADAGSGDGPETVIAETEAATITDSRDDVAPDDAANAHPHKRVRAAEDEIGIPAKKIHRKRVEVAPNADAFLNQ
ncbi:unnamed protein product [Peronospora destructor]|nr:unnamed protein product [Peronospora destructor]